MQHTRKSEPIGYIVVTFVFHREKDGRWTAYCEELGTATFGHSLAEAQEMLKDAVLSHLNALEEVGERERFFAEHGITLHAVGRKPERIPLEVFLDETTMRQPHLQFVHAH